MDDPPGVLPAEAERRLRESLALFQISQALTSTLDTADLLQLIVDTAVNTLSAAERGVLHLLEPESGDLRPVAVCRISGAVRPPANLRLGVGASGTVAATGQSINIADVTTDPRFVPGITSPDFASLLAVPLTTKGRVIGTLSVESTRPQAFDTGDERLMSIFAGQAAIALENARLYEQLQASERRYRLLVEGTADFIFTLDRAGRITYANAAFLERLAGARGDASPPAERDVIGRDVRTWLHPDERDRLEDYLARLDTDQILSPTEFRWCNPDGAWAYLIGSGSPLHDAMGQTVGVQIIARDVTELRRLREQLVQADKLSAIGQMVAGAAHELNNPLAVIIGHSQMLQYNRYLDLDALDQLRTIARAAERCRHIVQNLLTFARQRTAQHELFNLNQVIQEVLDLRGYQLRAQNITLNLNLAENLPGTRGDPYRFQQVLVNLITNAEQAMVVGHDRGTLTLRTGVIPASAARQPGASPDAEQWIRLEVIDDGPGIPPDVLPRIFDPFFTTRDVGQGTGLGLSVCFGIVQEHKGMIWAESEPGQGARFIVEIPVVPVESQPALVTTPVPSQQLFAPVVTPGRPPAVVLIVDDEPELANMLANVLLAAGYLTDVATSGSEAMTKLGAIHYQAIICDVKMSDISGTALHAAIHARDPGLARRMIILTGDVDSEATRTFLADTSAHFIAKPFDIEAVRSVVREVVEEEDSPL
jgi:two-component system NtrC family sensor kinase